MDDGMLITYDPLADVIAVTFREIEPGGLRGSRPLDDTRLLNIDHEGEIVGVEFLEASDGIRLQGVPRADEIEAALGNLRGLFIEPAAA